MRKQQRDIDRKRKREKETKKERETVPFIMFVRAYVYVCVRVCEFVNFVALTCSCASRIRV